MNAIAAASKALSARKEEVNRLNVFPVPDGDTGTNMSLTIESVVTNIARLPIGSSGAEARKAITTGALMGARGNSGVITSQILRGLCEGSAHAEALTADTVAAAFEKSVEVAFQAVRKPVEGTILTVLRDSASAAVEASKLKLDTEAALETIVSAAYDSVQRTPELLPVLKENGVVDAGGFGLAILFDAFVSALLGKEGTLATSSRSRARPLRRLRSSRSTTGRVRLSVTATSSSSIPTCSIPLRRSSSSRPWATASCAWAACRSSRCTFTPTTPTRFSRTSSSAVRSPRCSSTTCSFESEERTEKLAAEQAAERKPIGFVAVAEVGQRKRSSSLGVDVVVSGGQTMNPSTKDLLDAMTEVNADAVIVMPNDSNIVVGCAGACELADFPCGVVPTKSMPGVRRHVHRGSGGEP